MSGTRKEVSLLEIYQAATFFFCCYLTQEYFLLQCRLQSNFFFLSFSEVILFQRRRQAVIRGRYLIIRLREFEPVLGKLNLTGPGVIAQAGIQGRPKLLRPETKMATS